MNNGPERLAEDRIRHLEMIQAVINRMANSSATVKNLCLIIAAGALAFAGQTLEPQIPFYAAILTLFFWFLDAKYLQQEKWFRDIYEREKGKSPTESADFVVTPDRSTMQATTVAYGLASWSTRALYIPLIVFLVIVAVFLWRQPLN